MSIIPSERNRRIDALRGISAIMIAILHITEAYVKGPIRSQSLWLHEFLKDIDLGRSGITILFMISGFVICTSFKDYARRPALHFLTKRIFRLYPLFWFSIIPGIIFIWILNNRDWDWTLIFANASLYPSLFSERYIIGLYWSLETEMTYYLMAAGLFIVGWYRSMTKLLIVILGLYAVLVFVFLLDLESSLTIHWLATPFHLSLVFLGTLTRYYFDDPGGGEVVLGRSFGKKTLFYLAIMIVAGINIAILILYFINGSSTYVTDAISYLLGIIGFFIGMKYWTKPNQLIVVIGLISYSVYLLHPIVFNGLRPFFAQVGWLHWNISWYLLICLVITILISYITYRLIEEPTMNLGRRLAKKWWR